jgi:HK97 family phage prohead protease
MKFEIRSTPKGKTISGYAARYGVLSGNLGGFYERIKRGAFDAVLRSKPDTFMLYNHDPNKVLGRTNAGTLRLAADANGLSFDCDLPNTSYANDLAENVQRGNINSCSFAFKVDAEDAEFGEEQVEEEGRGLVRSIVRTIKNFRALLDCSLVTYPAYPGTSVALRSLDASRGALRHYESLSAKPFISAKELDALMNGPDRPVSFNEAADRQRAIIRERQDILSLLL